MNRCNFDNLMQAEMQSAAGKKLLLHCCCAPCSSACLERLHDFFKITVFFYNPNIEDEEYNRRKAELVRFIEETGWAHICNDNHDTAEFYSRAKGLEKCPEGGERCIECFKLRLEKTVAVAKDGGYDYFATTLTVSPLKNAEIINAIGESLQSEKCRWLHTDFKKRNGYLRSVQLSKEHGLYRQDYCGCAFSKIRN